jgi:hypothetical protein
VLGEAGLPAPLRGLAQSYFAQASDAQLVAIVDTLEQVVVELRKAQDLDAKEKADGAVPADLGAGSEP